MLYFMLDLLKPPIIRGLSEDHVGYLSMTFILKTEIVPGLKKSFGRRRKVL